MTQVRENRAYVTARHIDVPWSNKDLELKWEHFTSKLGPAQKETWTLSVSNRLSPIGNRQSATAELVATLYDESLDQYLGHSWQQRFGFFRYDYSQRHDDFANVMKAFQHLTGNWRNDYVGVELRYRQFPGDLVANFWGYQFAQRNRFFAAKAGAMDSMEMSLGAPMPAAAPAEANLADASAARADGGRLAKASHIWRMCSSYTINPQVLRRHGSSEGCGY